MKLADFVKPLSLEERAALARASGTSFGHLRNVAFSGKACSPLLASALERETRHEVRRWETRPDDWHLIWPELVGAVGAPPVPIADEAAA